MIDIKLLRADADAVRKNLSRRGGWTGSSGSFDTLDRIAELDRDRRATITQAEDCKARKNALSKEVGRLKQSGQPADELMASVGELSKNIAELDARSAQHDADIERILLEIPNLPDPSLPDSENRVEKTVGETCPGTEAHWDIATRLGLCDFERGTKITGSRFYVLTGLGARLERALITFMLDTHLKAGYTEVMPPVLVNLDSMTGTGQYPKFADEYFTCERDALSLIPTAEVPVTNMHRDEILEELPVKYVSCTPCFRREAGAAGRDTRGVIRVHQFNKVELVKFVRPEDAVAEHELLTRDAERILEALGLSYRRVLLAANDIGFASAKSYDLDVWMPGAAGMSQARLSGAMGKYVEISSCSWFTDFQARRMRIRFRRDKKSKPELVHTINGSGLAVGRTWAAILEAGLLPDGTVKLPDALVPYMNGIDRITG